jgi:hypothetical protein
MAALPARWSGILSGQFRRRSGNCAGKSDPIPDAIMSGATFLFDGFAESHSKNLVCVQHFLLQFHYLQAFPRAEIAAILNIA